MVSAWAPQLLEVLSLKNNIVTIDAMGSQTDIAERIIAKEGDYVLAIKNNQELLFKKYREWIQVFKRDPDRWRYWQRARKDRNPETVVNDRT